MTGAEALKALKAYRQVLSSQQLRVLKGQILAGDISGAMKGLRKLIGPDPRKGERK